MDRYLAEFAGQGVKRRALTDLDPARAKRLPRYPLIPAAWVGRLAVGERFKRQRFGGILIMDLARRCTRAELAILALFVDAKDEAAAGCYLHLGFTRSASRPMSRHPPVATTQPKT